MTRRLLMYFGKVLFVTTDGDSECWLSVTKDGEGCNSNPKEAFYWMKEAADIGVFHLQFQNLPITHIWDLVSKKFMKKL